jgi:hypothetical protein
VVGEGAAEVLLHGARELAEEARVLALARRRRQRLQLARAPHEVGV